MSFDIALNPIRRWWFPQRTHGASGEENFARRIDENGGIHGT
jgi:hypothetical protein